MNVTILKHPKSGDLFEEFETCLAWCNKREENDRSWKVKASDVLKYDASGNLLSVNLDIKNPKAAEDFEHLPPDKLVEDILAKEEKIRNIIIEIRNALTVSE